MNQEAQIKTKLPELTASLFYRPFIEIQIKTSAALAGKRMRVLVNEVNPELSRPFQQNIFFL
jgi:hypothetical protein